MNLTINLNLTKSLFRMVIYKVFFNNIRANKLELIKKTYYSSKGYKVVYIYKE